MNEGHDNIRKGAGRLSRAVVTCAAAVGLLACMAGAFAWAGGLTALSTHVSDSVYEDIYGTGASGSTQSVTLTDSTATGSIAVSASTSTGTDDDADDYNYSYLTFTPDDTCYWAVSAASTDEQVRVSILDTSDNYAILARASGSDPTASVLLTSGTKYVLAFAFYDADAGTFETDTAGTISYDISKVSATEVSLDASQTVRVSSPGATAVWKVSATTESASYKFSAASDDKRTLVRLYDENWNLIASNSYNSLSQTLDGNATTPQTYYVATRFNSQANTGRYTFTAHERASISGGKATVSESSVSYTGFAVTPAVTVTDSSGSVVDDSDYDLSYADNTDVGTATVSVEDWYGNTLSTSFTISAPGTADATVAVGETTTVTLAAGESAVFSFTPTSDGTYVLATQGDYDTYLSLFSGSSLVDENDDSGSSTNAQITQTLQAGTTYYVVVRMYSSSKSGSFTFSVTSLVGVDTANTASDIDSSYATGTSSIASAASVGTTSVAYFSSSGSYAYYSLTPSATATYELTVSGNSGYEKGIYLYSSSSFERLASKTTYSTSATLTESLDAGTAYCIVLYCPSSGITLSLDIAQLQSISGATVALEADEFSFTGSAIEPAVTVTSSSGTVLSADDYDVSYTSNTWPGTAKATVTDAYGTTIKKTFAITAPTSTVSMSSAASATVAAGSSELWVFTADSDGEYLFTATTSDAAESYAVTVFDPLEKASSASSEVSGAGSASAGRECYQGDDVYVRIANTGSTSAAFTLEVSQPADVDGATVTLGVTSATFTGGYITPAVTVTKDGSTLDSSSYAVSYSSNRWPGTATVTVTGADDTAATATFQIVAPSFTSATAVAPNQLVTGSVSAGSFKLYKVTPSEDFDYEFSVSSRNGAQALLFDSSGTLLSGPTTWVTETLSKGETYYLAVCLTDATESASFVLYTYGPSTLDNAVVTVASGSYAGGAAVTPAVTVTLDGGTLTAGSDYSVSYSDNTSVGTGTVTVTGKGEFSGSQTATFSIGKGASTVKATGSSKSVKGKYKKKKLAKNVTVKGAVKVSGAAGTVTYSLAKKVKGVSIDKKGVITIKKGSKKGTYKISVKVTDAGNANYNSGSATATVTVKLK